MNSHLHMDQRIVIAISGGIAAYKTVGVIRELQKRGYGEIETILTDNGSRFVTPVTVGAITGKVPYTDTFESGRALSHISLVQPCGILAVVPATASKVRLSPTKPTKASYVKHKIPLSLSQTMKFILCLIRATMPCH